MDTQDRPDPVAKARDLGAAIAAAADAIESTRRIPEPLLARLHASRLLRMLLPRSAGGDQTEPGTYVLAVEEIARHDASVAWNVFVANSSALIAAFLELDVARTIFADAAHYYRLGPAQRHACDRRCRRLSRQRHLGFRQRLPQCQLDGRALPRGRDRWLPPAQSPRPTGDPHALVSRRAGDLDRHLEHHRPARHGLRFLRGGRHVSSPKPTAPRARTRLCAASGDRSTPSPCRASMPSAWRASLSASRGRCSMSSSAWHCERPRAPWGVWPTMRSCRRT